MTSKIQDFVEHNFQHDLVEKDNTYPASDVQWVWINDLNNNIYGNQYINFSNLNMVGASPNKLFDWSQAYASIPFRVRATIANGTFSTANKEDYVGAVAPKGFQHIVDLIQLKYGGITVNRGSQFNNLVMNERLKQMTADEQRLYGDIMSFYLDGELGYKYHAAVSEINNEPQKNYGLMKRLEKNNVDSQAGSLWDTVLGSQPNIDSLQGGLVSVSNTVLEYQWLAIIPLAKLHDFFDKMPSVASANGFELRLQTNIGSSNNWAVKYVGLADPAVIGATNQYDVESITSNQAVGNCCPLQIARATTPTIINTFQLDDNTPFSGLGFTQSAANVGATITLTSEIGWSSGTLAVSQPCRIWVPQVTFTPSYTRMILDAPKCKVLYDDYYIDSRTGVAGGTALTALFSAQISRPRTLYIIPFFSAKATCPVVTQSPVSSAPTSCSLCRLRNVQVQIGGQNIFLEAQQYNFQFYQHNVLPLLAEQNGNAVKSKDFSGLVSKTAWEKCYNVFAFDLQKVGDEISDNMPKSFQLQFQVNAKSTVSYDFYFVMTYQNTMYIDRATGEVTSSS